ncbi:MAG TPA: polysaccharide deacetylase family protein [Chitinophagaceae bacterium]|jgi:peptidoglycan/xylan/chitin deacetylase (PgdA/CDA1 family)|nr:polysaccharide deacetylase family protein [Chitinophagaceae bacterium]
MGRLQQIRYFFEHRAIVLMYHRIAEVGIDPWQLAVTPQNFEQQLQVLRKTNLVIPVTELADRLTARSFPHNSVSITFDDGYIDNLQFAKPLLEKYECPATFFIATGYVGARHEFWWDELERIILKAPLLPGNFSMYINDELYTYDLGADQELTAEQTNKHRSWVWPQSPPTRRCEMYLTLWERLKPLNSEKLLSYLHIIRQWAGQNNIEQRDQWPVDQPQLRELAAGPLFEIGIHTVTHPALGCHSYEVQQQEIANSREFLERTIGGNINTIAFPYGSYNEATLNIVREMKLKAAFTTQDRLVIKTTDPVQLGRFQVKNWDGAQFEHELYKWMKKF